MRSGIDEFEGWLYAKLDASGMKRDKEIKKERFQIGPNTHVELTIKSLTEDPIHNRRQVNSSISFSIQFWQNEKTIYRIDNSHGFLHYHDDKVKHEKIDESKPISQIICHAFEEGKIRLKTNGIKFTEGKEFVGTA